MEIKVTPDLRVVAGKMSGLTTNLLTRIFEDVGPNSARVVEAAYKRNTPVRSGRGRDSIRTTYQPTVRGRSFRLVTSGESYLRYVSEGTAPHVIRPRNARLLAWLGDNGEIVFARSVLHPGQRGTHFFERGWEEVEPEIRQMIREAGLRAWRELAKFK